MSDVTSEIFLQHLRYVQVASTTALVYDYLLTFGAEVDLIWAKKWNFVTLLFAIVRYTCFFLITMNYFFLGIVSWTPKVGLMWFRLRVWTPYIYRIAMDIIMMARLYALSLAHNPSSAGKYHFLDSAKWVLGIMVAACITKYAVAFTSLFLITGPNSGIHAVEYQLLTAHLCDTYPLPANLMMATQYSTLIFEILLLALAVSYFISDVLQSWRLFEHKRWKVNDLMRILVRDSTIYFMIVILDAVLDVMIAQLTPVNLRAALSFAMESFLPNPFAPRLVLDLREQENRDRMNTLGESNAMRLAELPTIVVTEYENGLDLSAIEGELGEVHVEERGLSESTRKIEGLA